ncbi:MAG: hypothetical protein KDB53_19260, partial [Planctomycetes bacterium]|nr:hypothetical protein [Planctomycetota bacterium]
MRTHTLGRGGFGVSIDEAGCLRDLWFPETGGENHLVGNRCALGLGLGDRVVWTHDPGWEMESRPVEAGRRAWTRLHHPQSGVTLLLLDELTPDGDGLMRHVRWLDSAEIRRLPRALYFHFDLQLMESDLAGCVRYEPDGRFLRHFKRQRQVLVGALRDGIPGIEEWTLGRRDENEGAGIRPDAARAELPRNPVAMGAGESLVALRAAADTSFPAITQVLLVATNEAELRTRWTRCLASYRHADPVAPLVARPDPVRALRSEALGLIASQCGIGGAILASTDGEILESARDSYAWCWPRDGAFVASALEMSGETGIPGRFYEYCRRALHPAGYLQQRYHADGSPGSTWHRAPHPDELWLPIQEDETALVLWALGESVHRSSRALYRELVLPAAEFLDHYRDEATRLPRPSHDLWE